MLFVFLLIIGIVSASENEWKSQLKDPAWQKVIEQNGMHIGTGRMKRYVDLGGNTVSNMNQPCTLPGGKEGRCKPVKHCLREEFKTDFIKFMDYMCVINDKQVGACCPDDTDKFGPEGLAGDLPATAPKEEDNEAIMRISRAENRGCGLSTSPHTRLMGSRPTNVREWPWMASVTPIGFEQYCGGVLITDRHVLTAAHCTRRWDADELEVRLGEYDMERDNESRTYNFKVVEKRQHANFELATYKNDIAILKLHRPTIFNTYVWPICLPPLGLDLVNETAVIIGWGTQSYGGANSPVLMEVSVPVWDQQKCINSFTEPIFEENICAAGYAGKKDACQGDSGGPLMYQMPSGRWATIGVVSWGVRCGEPSHPGIYTRVDKYLQWIVENVTF